MYKDYKAHKDKWPNIATFFQLGFIPIEEAGSQVIGHCPFCGAGKKFYVNKDSKMWDCKVCMIAGGFETFVRETLRVYQKDCTSRFLRKLADLKSIPIEILEKYNFGYDALSKSYFLPVFNEKRKLMSVRMFNNNKFMNMHGFTLYPFGVEALKNNSAVYLAEGEWDKFALEAMIKEENKDACSICIPGAGTFKEEWANLFTGKEVYVCYDNDMPGKKGAARVYNFLSGKCKKLEFINWPDGLKDGYDIRDFYIENKAPRFKQLHSYMRDTPMTVDGVKLIKSTGAQLDSYDGSFVDPEDVYKVYTKWLYMADTEVLDVLFGTIIANRLPGEPLWLFLVATSGGSKTELLTSLSDGPNIVTTSSITPRSLISGAQTRDGSDPSLIPKLDGKVLMIKDFTILLKNNEMLREELFGILRDAYDGKTEKEFGSGVKRSYISKFAIIAAVTNAIDQYTDGESALGERFLKYRINIPEDPIKRLDYIRKAQSNVGKELIMKKELSDVAKSVISYAYPNVPTINSKINEKVIMLSQFVAMMRATVTRDKFHKDNIIYAPSAELGTRLAKQYNKFLLGISMFKGEKAVSDNVYNTVKHIGISSISKIPETIVSYMYKSDKDGFFDVKDFKNVLPISPLIVERKLEDLSLVGILETDFLDGEKINLKKRSWKLSKGAKYLIKSGDLYE